jgi:hypothetical protein
MFPCWPAPRQTHTQSRPNDHPFQHQLTTPMPRLIRAEPACSVTWAGSLCRTERPSVHRSRSPHNFQVFKNLDKARMSAGRGSAGGDDAGVLPAGMPSSGRASGQRIGINGGSQPISYSRSQAGGEKKYARHEARAAPQYWLPRPAAGIQQAWDRRPTRPLYEEPVGQSALHQRYNEHPFLLQKDVQLNRDVGKTCLSFGAHCPTPAAVRASPTHTLEPAAVRPSLHAPASSPCWWTAVILVG